MLAQEFFYRKYREAGSERFFGIYLFLRTGRRYALCPCMFNEWITLTPDSQIRFCATPGAKLEIFDVKDKSMREESIGSSEERYLLCRQV